MGIHTTDRVRCLDDPYTAAMGDTQLFGVLGILKKSVRGSRCKERTVRGVYAHRRNVRGV